MRNDAESLPTALCLWFIEFFCKLKYYKAYSPPPPLNPQSQPFVNILRHSASTVQPISNPRLKEVLLG